MENAQLNVYVVLAENVVIQYRNIRSTISTNTNY
jgi:hypothetical protein